MNTDEDAEWSKFGIQGIPTMLFVANGKIIHRQTGAAEGMLREVVDQFPRSSKRSPNTPEVYKEAG